MKGSRSLWIAVAALIIWLVLTWFLGVWLGLHPPALNYLRAGLWIIGIIGFAGYLILRPKQRDDAGQTSASGSTAEMDFIFNEASNRMQAAKGARQLGAFPAVFLLGDTASAKTSVIAKSGLEPELLAGHAYQDYVVAPTRTLNLWYARETLFVDPAGSVISDPGARRRLFRKLLPVRLNTIMAAKLPPGRSVVFTVDAEAFLQAGAAEALTAKARQFQAVLAELARELGSSFPVYVVFTKADKIRYFADYVSSFTDAEAAEVFGVTLPMRADRTQGVYSEQQTRRLTEAFQDLYYSLCDRRPKYLGRENDPARLPNIYEFPREFAKIRSLLVQFLVDLCRPSQLGTSPFLRGFYFTGVRPVTVADVAPPAHAPVQQQGFDPGATRIFTAPAQHAALTEGPRESGPRRLPQWVFLGHLFPDLILADRPAAAVTQRNVKVNVARRLLLGAAAVIGLVAASWWLVSYINNRALVRDAVDSATPVPGAGLASGQLASTESLLRLTRMRDTLVTLNNYERDGVPMRLDAFLYAGNSIREPLRAAYYASFRKLLLAPTQSTLVAICSKPDAYEAQGYSYLYNALKAYLITTKNHEKSTPEFLAPVLLQHWQNNQQADEQRQKLAQKNFEFYAAELAARNPYPQYANPDDAAVETARDYLKRFKQEDRIYQALLAGAGEGRKPIVFNLDYPGSAETVINRYKVDPAFTKGGYEMFHKELEDPARYFGGEEWVLGERINAAQDRITLKRDMNDRYQQDFVNTWQAYLNATSIAGYASVQDAAHKLDKLSGPDSSLLRVLCVASENTSADKEAAQTFQPVQFVTPPGCAQKLVGQSNNAYMQSLIALKSALQSVGPIGNADPMNVAAANNNANQAENAVSTLALSFVPDPKSTVLSKTKDILREPIIRVPALLKGAGAGPVNAAAKDLCASIQAMLSKYPFNPRSTSDATLQEVNEFLKPNDGRLWQLYNTSLKQYLVPAGNEYVRASGQQLSATPAFLNFFNRAAHMSQALYRGDAQQPSLTFAMQPLPSQDVSHVTLTIDGQTLSADLRSGARPQTFTWPGATPAVFLGVSFGGGPEFTIAQTTGLWAIWHFLDTGERLPSAGNQIQMQWVQKTSAGVTNINGHPAAVKFALDAQGSQIFHPQYFNGLTCVSKALQ